jgi:hypothetical protein
LFLFNNKHSPLVHGCVSVCQSATAEYGAGRVWPAPGVGPCCAVVCSAPPPLSGAAYTCHRLRHTATKYIDL